LRRLDGGGLTKNKNGRSHPSSESPIAPENPGNQPGPRNRIGGRATGQNPRYK
jgi:hypothetical protein